MLISHLNGGTFTINSPAFSSTLNPKRSKIPVTSATDKSVPKTLFIFSKEISTVVS